ncbi:L,D-transpeptidase [candidate division KSB1 bacterium]|nr:L,D-transpeptidase [candidate division KSB1 bacterium]
MENKTQKTEPNHVAQPPRNDAAPAPISAEKKIAPHTKPFALRAIVWGIFLGLVLMSLTLFYAPALREGAFALLPDAKFVRDIQAASVKDLQQQLKKAEKDFNTLRNRLDRLIPRDYYLIVNSSENQIIVMKNTAVVHKGTCSTGSNVMLKAALDDRQWFFATPRGMFRVHGKIKNPSWRMPDWAFIEEGLPVPAANSPERIQYGVLGDYALSFGNGYFVHGTLYKRTLGMPVTHGCIRLDDDDLIVVYKNLQVGSKIFVY